MIGFYDIKGEVKTPGVYKVENIMTINDAISIAGGLTKKSDTSKINLSKQVKDEMVIYIFKKSNYIIKSCNCKKNYVKNCDTQTTTTSITVPTTTISSTNISSTTKLIESFLININTSSLEELLSIKGLGLVKAQNIIKYREEKGLFNNIEDIKNVSGIGVSLFEKIKEFITI